MLDGDQPHTWHYLPDVARGFATLILRPDANGRVWILPAAPPLTQQQVADLVNSMIESPVKVRKLTPVLVALAAFVSRQARVGRKIAHQFDRPWVSDASAFDAAFGTLAVTDHQTAVAATLNWLRTGAVAVG